MEMPCGQKHYIHRQCYWRVEKVVTVYGCGCPAMTVPPVKLGGYGTEMDPDEEDKVPEDEVEGVDVDVDAEDDLECEADDALIVDMLKRVGIWGLGDGSVVKD